METLVRFVERNFNAKATAVSQTEQGDGVGVGVGRNYVKNSKFYTEKEALDEIGVTLKFASGNLDAKTRQDAENQAIAAAKAAGVKAMEILKIREMSRGYHISYCYIK